MINGKPCIEFHQRNAHKLSFIAAKERTLTPASILILTTLVILLMSVLSGFYKDCSFSQNALQSLWKVCRFLLWSYGIMFYVFIMTLIFVTSPEGKDRKFEQFGHRLCFSIFVFIPAAYLAFS